MKGIVGGGEGDGYVVSGDLAVYYHIECDVRHCGRLAVAETSPLGRGEAVC